MVHRLFVESSWRFSSPSSSLTTNPLSSQLLCFVQKQFVAVTFSFQERHEKTYVNNKHSARTFLTLSINRRLSEPNITNTTHVFLLTVYFSSNRFIFIIAEVIRKEQKSSDYDAKQAAKHWFKGVTDRKGGRKLRKAKKWTKACFSDIIFSVWFVLVF